MELVQNPKIKLFVAIPSTHWVSDYQSHILRKIEKKYSDRIEFIYPENCVHRFGHAYARNAMVDEFLKTDAEILWFLDSEVGPPDKVLDIVTEHHTEWQVAGAPYPVVMAVGDNPIRQLLFTAYKESNGKAMVPCNVPVEGTDWLNGVATGCMFIKRGVFLRLEKPDFAFKDAHEDQKAIEGEDLGFCLKVNALGLKFFTDYSCTCSHTKEVDLLEMNNYAMDLARRSVEGFAAQMRKDMAEQAKQIAAARAQKVQAPQKTLWVPR